MRKDTTFSARSHVRPARTKTHADQSLDCPPEDIMDPWLPTECPAKTLITARMRRLICLRCAHMQLCKKHCALAQTVSSTIRAITTINPFK